MQVSDLQQAIIQEIENIGGRIVFRKQWGRLARMQYRLFGKEPVINLEALLLGERFGVIIGHPAKSGHIVSSSKHRIFQVDNLAQFKEQFSHFKSEKLAKT